MAKRRTRGTNTALVKATVAMRAALVDEGGGDAKLDAAMASLQEVRKARADAPGTTFGLYAMSMAQRGVRRAARLDLDELIELLRRERRAWRRMSRRIAKKLSPRVGKRRSQASMRTKASGRREVTRRQ